MPCCIPSLWHPVAVSAHMFGSKARTRTAAKRQHFCCQPLHPAQLVRVIRLMENVGFQLETMSKTCGSFLEKSKQAASGVSKSRRKYCSADSHGPAYQNELQTMMSYLKIPLPAAIAMRPVTSRALVFKVFPAVDIVTCSHVGVGNDDTSCHNSCPCQH